MKHMFRLFVIFRTHEGPFYEIHKNLFNQVKKEDVQETY